VILIVIFQLALGAGAWQPPVFAAGTPGISVNAQGVISYNGASFRGIGVDFFDAFLRTLTNSTAPTIASYQNGFQVLEGDKILFTRMILGGFSPSDYQLYRNNKAAYFALMDGVVQSAEDNHVGIIADLFWCINSCADIAGEHMNAYDDPTSGCYVFMRQYIDDVVGRYKDSPAIWGWECGNEYNLFNDLSNGYSFLPVGYGGSPATRDPVLDNFPHQRTCTILSEFAKEVRKIDPNRIIVSGNALPRNAAWHLGYDGSWTQDTKAEFTQVLLRDNPDPLNAICIHAYASDGINSYFADQNVDYSGLLAAVKQAGATVKKPVFLGECGTPAYLDSACT
jgi:hypothetical protein